MTPNYSLELGKIPNSIEKDYVYLFKIGMVIRVSFQRITFFCVENFFVLYFLSLLGL